METVNRYIEEVEREFCLRQDKNRYIATIKKDVKDMIIYYSDNLYHDEDLYEAVLAVLVSAFNRKEIDLHFFSVCVRKLTKSYLYGKEGR